MNTYSMEPRGDPSLIPQFESGHLDLSIGPARPATTTSIASSLQERKTPGAANSHNIQTSINSDDHTQRAPDDAPEGGRIAWTQVLASFLINMNVYGLVNAFGEFQHYYETESLREYSSSEISWIGTVQGSLTLFVGALAGPIFDRGYFMVTLRGAAAALVFSWMMLSLSTEYYQIMLSQGVLGGICVGLMEVPSIALVPDYFKKRLGLALGLAVSGAPVGGVVYSVVFRSLLTATSFGWATRAIGFINLVTLGIAIVIIKPKDANRQSASRRFFDLSAFREVPFLCIFVDAFFAYCAALIPYFVTPAFATSLGSSSTTATYLLAVLNAAQFFGRVIPSALSDYYGGAKMLLVAQALIGLLGLHWITIRSLGGFIEFIIITGFISGMVATLPPITIPLLNPDKPETLGTRIGMIYAAAGLGVLVGNPIALATVPKDVTSTGPNGFLGVQLFMGLCALVGAAFFVVPAKVIGNNWKKYVGGIDRSPRVDVMQMLRGATYKRSES